MDLKQIIADWIKDARTAAGLSQDALGGKLSEKLNSERGYSKGNISHWEKQNHEPSIQQIIAIKDITGKSLPPDLMRALGAIQESVADSNKSQTSIDEIIELVALYQQSTETGRGSIFNTAREAAKSGAIRWARVSGD